MTIATVLGLFIIPVCYVFVQRLSERGKKPKPVETAPVAAAAARRKEERTDETPFIRIRSSDFGFQRGGRRVSFVRGAPRRLAGCAVGPDYKRPTVDSPGAFRRAASDTNAPAGTNSFADLGWWEVFKDPQLTAYMAEALTNSWDIKIAAARVLQAEACCAHHPFAILPDRQCRWRSVTSRTSEKGPSSFHRAWIRSGTYGDVFLVDARLRGGSLGTHPPRQRSRPRPIAGHASRRNAPCARRSSPHVATAYLRPAGTRSRTRNRPAHLSPSAPTPWN